MSNTLITRICKLAVRNCCLTASGQMKRFSTENALQSGSKVLQRLSDRSLLQISGKETTAFLQGLITNDMKNLDEGAANIYTLFLNIKGRVLYDTIIYKTIENKTYYIECDSRVIDSLEKHLKMYRVRKKIDIIRLNDEMRVWSAFDPIHWFNQAELIKNNKSNLESSIFPCGISNNNGSKFMDNFIVYEDPRSVHLGIRILAKSKIEKEEIIKRLHPVTFDTNEMLNYREFLYRIGVGEGIDDLPPGKPLPLEINCDYLHGISFHKGCYIGQELTARTYHTGVVRKRLMPLIFDRVPIEAIPYDEKIVDENNKVVGKFRGNRNEFGLGLMRINETLKTRALYVQEIPIKVTKPLWWPQDSKKEILLER